MELGLGALGLQPRVFWNLTPRELQAALRGRFGSPADSDGPSRRHLHDLMQRFPDEGAQHGND
ncbi:phage tail assembly chaperone [Hyphomicrobium sp. MC1]|uniref:phage tail assembly chaperone n=1 Tax=Hyphomicrobium sp. (strain MC1) TaxID=717785 RepID=UPI000213D35A|nr:phage tail assembly chaperone [Hyphomicrobium sp. MC1]CCB65599.1 conserved protein of unknown function [Hyphomicrobium sp. MC1]